MWSGYIRYYNLRSKQTKFNGLKSLTRSINIFVQNLLIFVVAPIQVTLLFKVIFYVTSFPLAQKNFCSHNKFIGFTVNSKTRSPYARSFYFYFSIIFFLTVNRKTYETSINENSCSASNHTCTMRGDLYWAYKSLVYSVMYILWGFHYF